MNELDELVYAMEDLDLSEKFKAFMNKEETGDTGAPQEKFETDGSKSIKEEIWNPEIMEENSFVPKVKKNKDYTSQFHNNSKAKYMSNRLPTGDVGSTQFLDLDCKRYPEVYLDRWSQEIFLYFLLGKGINYTKEEKYIIMINTFSGKVSNWFTGLTDDAKEIIKINVIDGLKTSLQEGIKNLVQYVANEFLGGEGSVKDNREKVRIIAKEQLEKLQICKMSYIQEYTCEFEEYYYRNYTNNRKT